MKPLRLVFNGVNSFSSPAVIDFEKLTLSGLFGIFGDTGSGKSTILDSINFALYGDVDRSKKKIDIINYNCDQAEVEFTFNILIDGVRRVYRVERSIKKKNGLGKAMLYRNDGSGEVCIADNTTSVNAKIEEILGLSAEDFRKCIALPQGEFAQFVKSAPSERFKLIERLFSLNKYGDGLRERLSEAENDAVTRLNEVLAKYEALSDVDEQLVKSLGQSCTALEGELAALESQSAKSEEQVTKLRKLFEIVTELNATESKLGEYAKQSGKMEKLRAELRSVPACRKISEDNARKLEAEKLAKDCVARSQDITKKLGEGRAMLQELVGAKEKSDFEGQLEKLAARLAVLQSAMQDVALAEEEARKLRSLRAEYVRVAEQKKKLAEKAELAERNAAKSKEDLDKCVVPEISQVLENSFKPGILRQEYTDQLTYLGELREAIKGYDDKSPLYKFVREELTGRMNYYKSLLTDFANVSLDVRKELERVDRLSAQKDTLYNIYSKAKDASARAERELALATSNCQKIAADGEQSAERLARVQEKLKAVFGENCTDYSDVAASAKEGFRQMKERRDRLDRDIDGARKDISALELTLGECNVKQTAAEQEIKKLSASIAEQLSSCGFESVAQCESLLSEVSSYGDAEAALRKYDEQMYALKSRREKLISDKGNDEVSAEQLDEAQKAFAELKNAVKEKHAEQRLISARLQESRYKLAKKNELEKQVKERSKRRELIFQLKELVKGNKFLEYIAGEYLSDISKAASATLLKLTMGRYYLTYSDTFYVADNFNEGKLRGVNTLSGGETFLVSLSLALALSSSICKSSMRSIEFFFLDEGFGTLDESLVDTVMDTLEKLRSSDFTIGIISHVEELKHRIDSKITVNKATETHGSTITVSV